jgi:cell pole-organizing protein PopZ
MSEPKPQAQQSEPSMEEILASIRRIISEDDRPGAKKAEPAKEAAEPAPPPPPAPPAKEPAASKADEDEVLELTEEVAQAPEPAPSDESDESDVVIELKDRIVEEPEAPEDAPRGAPEAAEGLLSRPAAAAAAASFAQLAAQVASERNSVPLGIGMRTLEDIVKEVMRPMIKEWLDAHLPSLVERLVAHEITRVSGRGQDAA